MGDTSHFLNKSVKASKDNLRYSSIVDVVFCFRALVTAARARITEPVKPVLQTGDIVVYVLQSSEDVTAKLVVSENVC